ncbi:RICIN domain-containing protein [Vibrio sp. 10N.286.52.F8]|uniref:RICIN domain-containing protein n=1 Tax=Vibrio sp. 10N.286.52.F8 TaxID=3229716 RepID=UPI003553E453
MKIVPTATLFLSGLVASVSAQASTYIQLVDKLDRPVDGYCLDVVGNGRYVRFDMPLTAHNCKGPQPYDDEIVELAEDGSLFFGRYQGCVTVMGNNQTALAGNALMLKACGIEEPFLNGPVFQKFFFNSNQQLQLKNSQLCIVAGAESHTTSSLTHRWRSLYMDYCETTKPKLSQWHVIPAGVKQP